MSSFLDQLPDDFEIEVPDAEKAPEDVDLGGGGNTRFCQLTLYSLPVKPFVSGASFELPGVYTLERDGLRQFKGMQPQPGSNTILYVFVANSVKQDGSPIQIVRVFKGWKQGEQKDSEGKLASSGINQWKELQWPHLEAMSLVQRKKLMATYAAALKGGPEKGFVYASYREAETGLAGQYDPKQALTEITVYDSEAKWKEARDTFFAQFENGATANGYVSLLPDIWQKEEEKKPGIFASYINDNWGDGSAQIITMLGLEKFLSDDLVQAVAMIRGVDSPAPLLPDEIKAFGG